MGSAHPAAARRMRGRGTALLLLAATTACRGPVPLVTLEAGPAPSLRLVAASGVRINARLKPALELDGGRVLRFDSPYLTSDSAYFAAPPTAAPVPPGGPHRGTLRASVCPSGEHFCRSVELAVTW